MTCSKCHKDPCNCGCKKPCDTSSNCSTPCHGETVDLACVEYNGNNLNCAGIEKFDTGVDILHALDTTMCDLIASKGKVYVNSDSTCLNTLQDSLSVGPGLNIAPSGAGCANKLHISLVGPGAVFPDEKVKVSAGDSTPGTLSQKVSNTDGRISIGPTPVPVFPATVNQTLAFNLNMATVRSQDPTNQIVLAPFDGGLYFNGLSIPAATPCWDGGWHNVTILPSSAPSLGTNKVQYKIMFDGSVHFRGFVEYTALFKSYKSSNVVTPGVWGFQLGVVNLQTMLNTGTPCSTSSLVSLPVGEQRIVKSLYFMDVPANTTPAIVQSYGANLTWTGNQINASIFGSYEADTTKVVRISFDGIILEKV